VRALLAAIRCHKDDLEQNLAAHLGLLAEAKAEGGELATEPVVFDHAGARFGVAICAEAGFDGPPPASPSPFTGRRGRCPSCAAPRRPRPVRPAHR
jgi:predicted amidohydrolase